MRRILQFVPALTAGDATGMHALMIADALRAKGIETKFFVEEVKPNQIEDAERFPKYARDSRPDDIVIYHLAAPSAIADFLSSRHETLVIVYHNITPPHYFEPWDQVAATGQVWARAQLSRLAPRTTLALPVSKFNQGELTSLGYGKSSVVPILTDARAFASGSDPKTMEYLESLRSSGSENFLFVGRLVPNKAQHNLIAALSAFNKIYKKNAMLHLVGRPFSRGYFEMLKAIASELEVSNNVNFAMGVTSDQLASYYKMSDAFISLSEHEGFGVPLLEAMHNKLPILAFDSSAIKETLGGAGLVISRNDPVTTAVAMNKITSDYRLRSFLDRLMSERLDELSLIASRQKLYRALGELEPALKASPACSDGPRPEDSIAK